MASRRRRAGALAGVIAVGWLVATTGCPAVPTLPIPPGPTAELPREVALTDAHNFRYEATLDVAVAPVAAGEDVAIDWSGLTTDVLGNPVDPYTDVASLLLLLFPDLTPDEVTDDLVHERLSQADVGLFTSCTGTDARCLLSEFGVLGVPIPVPEHFTVGSGSWLAAARAVDDVGALAYLFLEPVAPGGALVAYLTDDSSTLTLEVDLRSLEPLAVRPDGDVTVDWSALTRDGLGDELDGYRLDRISVARHDTRSLDELEASFHEAEDAADALWSLDVEGRSEVHLGELLPDDPGGEPLAALDPDATWLLALWCGSCTSPMPRFVTVVIPGG